MLDPARLIERPRVYDVLIPLLAKWGYNLLLWHFIDDEGCAMLFPRRPELASPHALTPRQMRGLIELGRATGMMIVPEVECFGHTRHVVRMRKYAHLRDGAIGKHFRAMCPFHRDARLLLKDLLTDTAETFDSPYIHVGMDEVGFGTHPLSRKLLRTKKKWELFADHANWLHEVVTGLGKQMMMWGDHLFKAPDHKYSQLDTDSLTPKILDRLPKDIIICDWHYRPDVPTEPMDLFLKKGFKVVACPAISAAGMMNHPSNFNLDNIRDFSREAHRRKSKGVLGTIVTVWSGWRWFPGVTLFGLALGAACQDSSKVDAQKIAERFVRQTFGTTGTATTKIASEILSLHRISPRRPETYLAMPVKHADVRGATSEQVEMLASVEGEAREIARKLKQLRRQVRQARDFYDDILFAAEVLSKVAARPARLASRGVAKSELILASKLSEEAQKRWRIWRFNDDAKRNGFARKHPYRDSLIQRLKGSADYLQKQVR